MKNDYSLVKSNYKLFQLKARNTVRVIITYRYSVYSPHRITTGNYEMICIVKWSRPKKLTFMANMSAKATPLGLNGHNEKKKKKTVFFFIFFHII